MHSPLQWSLNIQFWKTTSHRSKRFFIMLGISRACVGNPLLALGFPINNLGFWEHLFFFFFSFVCSLTLQAEAIITFPDHLSGYHECLTLP